VIDCALLFTFSLSMSSSWFNKRKERNLIPPVEPDSRSTSELSSSGTSVTYVDSSDRYQRNRAVDIYSRGQGNLETDRNELFSGYNPERVSTGRFAHDGPALPEPTGEENEEDVEGIKQQTRFMKQESVNSTRNALRMAREAEETARTTIGKLGNQSGTQRVVTVDYCLILIMNTL
jgi:protein transport protein SEC9